MFSEVLEHLILQSERAFSLLPSGQSLLFSYRLTISRSGLSPPKPDIFALPYVRRSEVTLALFSGFAHPIQRRPLFLMHADIQPLFRSPIVKIFDFKCKAQPGSVSQPEYIETDEINFTRTGYFCLRAGNRSWDIDNQVIILGNAGSEFVFTHGCRVSDECTVLQIPKALLEQAQQTFWQGRTAKSLSQRIGIHLLFPRPILYSTPSLDYLHRRLLAAARHNHCTGIQLQVETLLVLLIAEVYKNLYDGNQVLPARDMRLISRHHETVERAKGFMMTHFQHELSLSQIARHAYISEFHFSRLFKALTSYSPYRYLIEIRLHHAARLLQDTSDSVTEVCFASGFNSPSHFTATFTKFFGMSPFAFRHR